MTKYRTFNRTISSFTLEQNRKEEEKRCPISLFAALTASNLQPFSKNDWYAFSGVEGDGFIGEIEGYLIIVDVPNKRSLEVGSGSTKLRVDIMAPETEEDNFSGQTTWIFEVENTEAADVI